MPSHTVLIWAGATGAAVAAVGAGAIYLAHPSFPWPRAEPVVVSQPEPVLAPPPAPKKTAAPAPDKTAAQTPSASPPSASALAPVKPAFDVVSVEPTGEAVVAGRAAPNVKVVLLDGGRTVAVATTDAQGQFVMIPAPLQPGDHSLTLSTGAGGPADTSNAIPVSVSAPPVKTAAAAPQPASPALPSPPPGAPGQVAIHSVDASADGGMVAKGSAGPNATVRLYINSAYVGDARTQDDGRWSLTIEHGMAPGAYTVRADQIDPGSAKVVARAEAPFSFPASLAAGKRAPVASASVPAAASSPADVVIDALQTHHVERGHTLWGISQKFYGDGSRYGVIFTANSSQIRDPNLIYPGQTFLVPNGEPKP